MRMIYVGLLRTEPDRDSGWIDAFRKLDIEVVTFCSTSKVYSFNTIDRICRRLNVGPSNKRMQGELIALADCVQPNWIHFRLPVEFSRSTINALRERNILLTQYFNDDPFSIKTPFGLHWKFRHALTAYDAHFVYRAHNVISYQNAGAVHVEHCPPTYDPQRHYFSRSLSKNNDFIADVAFIGHCENDWRVDCLDTLKKKGFSVILKGSFWDNHIIDRAISDIVPVTGAFGDKYNYIYANVIAGLCFFSKINNDTWTERALEIIAVGGVLVCERTDEALSHFKDREEACYFSSIDELINIVTELKNNPEKREKVRLAGYRKLMSGSYTIDDRASRIVNFVRSTIKDKNRNSI